MARHPELAKRIQTLNEGPPAAAYASRMDSWANTLTGIGTDRDKVNATGFTFDGSLGFSIVEELFHNDDVSSRICSLLPELAFGQDFCLDDDKLETDMEELGACEAFENAAVFARAYGGAAVLCGMSGDMNTPARGAVESLMVLDRWSLFPKQWYKSGPKFGKPEIYSIGMPAAADTMGVGLPIEGSDVHESRLVVFPGARTSPRKKYANSWWDDSVLQRCYQVVQSYGITWASVVHLLQDAAQGVYSIKELWSMLLASKDIVLQRMQQVDEQRSSGKAILLDADNEKFERAMTPFNSIPELIDRLTERVSSAAETPLTVLMGSSPAGMNATGQSDLEIWYGKGRKYRTRVGEPAIKQLAALMGAKTPPKITWPAFWLPTAKEVAEEHYSNAQADQVYLVNRVVTPDEIRDNRRIQYNLPEGTKAPPPLDVVPGAPAAGPAAPGGANPGVPPGGAIGSRHYSPMYGR